MRTWTELWVSIVIQWASVLVGIFVVEFLIRFAGGRRDDPTPFVLFIFLLVFVNAVGKELYKRLEDLRERSEQMEGTLDELGRWRRIEMGEADESDLEP